MSQSPSPHLLKLLETLVHFPTVSDNQKALHQALNWIRKQLSGLPLHVQIIEHGGVQSLVATAQKTRTPALWLAGHLDVVPAAASDFTLTHTPERLVGRGVFDMKFALAAYVELLQELGPDLAHYNLGLMVTTDEETGGTHGTQALLESGFGGGVAFLPDGGNNWQLVEASRGMWHVQVTATGTANHGGRPWLGRNAITTLMAALAQLESFFPTEPCSQPQHFHSSLNIGTISGGTVTNQIPVSATATADIRFVTTDKPGLEALFRHLAEAYPGVTITPIAYGEPYGVDPQNQFVKAYTSALAAEGITAGSAVTHGTSDARFFSAHNIPVIVFRPDGGGHHSQTEWLGTQAYAIFYRSLTRFVTTTPEFKTL